MAGASDGAIDGYNDNEQQKAEENIAEMKGGVIAKACIALLYLLGVPVLVLMVPGFMLFLMEANLDARNYIAFSAVLTFFVHIEL